MFVLSLRRPSFVAFSKFGLEIRSPNSFPPNSRLCRVVGLSLPNFLDLNARRRMGGGSPVIFVNITTEFALMRSPMGFAESRFFIQCIKGPLRACWTRPTLANHGNFLVWGSVMGCCNRHAPGKTFRRVPWWRNLKFQEP